MSFLMKKQEDKTADDDQGEGSTREDAKEGGELEWDCLTLHLHRNKPVALQ